jgi:four helix bundle protein
MDNIEKIKRFKIRTKAMALEIITLVQALPKTGAAQVVSNQLLRSATCVAANYRAVCRAHSPAERYSKFCIAVEEADETVFGLEMLHEAKIPVIKEFVTIQPG